MVFCFFKLFPIHVGCIGLRCTYRICMMHTCNYQQKPCTYWASDQVETCFIRIATTNTYSKWILVHAAALRGYNSWLTSHATSTTHVYNLAYKKKGCHIKNEKANVCGVIVSLPWEGRCLGPSCTLSTDWAPLPARRWPVPQALPGGGGGDPTWPASELHGGVNWTREGLTHTLYVYVCVFILFPDPNMRLRLHVNVRYVHLSYSSGLAPL